jgi:hypothetical protein
MLDGSVCYIYWLIEETAFDDEAAKALPEDV